MFEFFDFVSVVLLLSVLLLLLLIIVVVVPLLLLLPLMCFNFILLLFSLFSLPFCRGCCCCTHFTLP